MSRAQTMSAMESPCASSRPRINPVVLAAVALFTALAIGELIVILHAPPALDPLTPYYVT